MTVDAKRKVFLIISPGGNRLTDTRNLITKYYSDPTIYIANSSPTAFAKLRNAHIDIIIADAETKNIDCVKVVEEILLQDKDGSMAVMIMGHPPKEEKFLDEIIIGRVCFLDSELNDNEFCTGLTKILNYSSASNSIHFNMKFLAPGEVLIKEGEEAKFIYILKSGELSAYNIKDGEKSFLGPILAGEFVGEMAYINNEKRSAYIEANLASELIEIPFGLVEKIIFSRPSWSKALIQTLSRRLKNVNKLVMT